jgi:hypothetical protein
MGNRPWAHGVEGLVEGAACIHATRAPKGLMLQRLDHPASSQKGHLADGSPAGSGESYKHLMHMYLTTLSDLNETRVCFRAGKSLPAWHLLPTPLLSIAVS